MNQGLEYKLCIKEKVIADKFYRELSSIDFYDTSDEVKRRINHKIEAIVDSFPNTIITKEYINRHGLSIKKVTVTWYCNKQKHVSIFWMDLVDCSTKNKYLL